LNFQDYSEDQRAMTWHVVFSLSNERTTNINAQIFYQLCVGQLRLVNSQLVTPRCERSEDRSWKRMGRVSVLSALLLGNQPKGLSRIEMQIRRRLVLVPSMAFRQKAGRTLALLKYIMPLHSSLSACLPKAKISETR